MKLRPYQEEARQAIENEWRKGIQKTLLVLPTGTGKTCVFSQVAADMVEQGERVLIMAHRAELLEQAQDKIYKMTGLESSIEKAEQTSLYDDNPIVVGSVQTLQSQKRLQRFPKDYFDTIIIDEAHHTLSDSYLRILDYFSNAKVLGVTATPDRGDMKNLGKVYESLAYEYTLPEAIKSGYLSPIKALTVPLNIDISNVGLQSGDYKASEVSYALDPYLEQIATEMEHYCKDRKTVVFLPLIAISQKFRDILNNHGFLAAEVNGNSTDREEILADFDCGLYDVICNSMLLTEGWDCPSVDCVVMLRPTKIRSLYVQAVGRGTRLSPGKKDLLILDFLWHTSKHELCRPTTLICKNEDTAKQMNEDLEENAGEEFDIIEAERTASSEVLKQREEALKQQLEENRKKKKKLVDPLQFEYSIQSEDLAGYVPTFVWEMMPPTQDQLNALEKFGLDPEFVDCRGKAAQLMDRLVKRAKSGLSTPKQIRLLERFGFVNVGTWKKADASKMIGRISMNNWRVPQDINPALYRP